MYTECFKQTKLMKSKWLSEVLAEIICLNVISEKH